MQGDRRQAVLRRYAQHPVNRLADCPGGSAPRHSRAVGLWLFSSSASKQAEACPSAVVLRPLSNTAVFGSAPEHRPDNVAFYGLLSEADLKCEYGGGNLKIALDAVIVGERGPAAKGDVAGPPIFRRRHGTRSIDHQQAAIRGSHRFRGQPETRRRHRPYRGNDPARRPQRLRPQCPARLSAKPRGRRLLQTLPRPLITRRPSLGATGLPETRLLDSVRTCNQQ